MFSPSIPLDCRVFLLVLSFSGPFLSFPSIVWLLGTFGPRRLCECACPLVSKSICLRENVLRGLCVLVCTCPWICLLLTHFMLFYVSLLLFASVGLLSPTFAFFKGASFSSSCSSLSFLFAIFFVPCLLSGFHFHPFLPNDQPPMWTDQISCSSADSVLSELLLCIQFVANKLPLRLCLTCNLYLETAFSETE